MGAHLFEIIEISESVSIKARALIERFTKSHGLLIPDALIAATALETDVPLCTANVSDFRFIPGLVLV
ncbi:MAG: PIN domain-containing protein [Treponemataceae bacterium]|nr:PIN domain-containing protein [Treponemataceae bacterium]